MKKQLRSKNIKKMNNVSLNIKSHFLQQNNDEARSHARQLGGGTTKYSLQPAHSNVLFRSSIDEASKDEKIVSRGLYL